MRIPLFLLREQATLEPYKGDTAYGPQYSQPMAVRCRTESPKQQKGLLHTAQGTEKVDVYLLGFFPADTPITEKSRVTLNGRAYVVKDVSPRSGLSASHVEALLAGL